jgi:hypothetical protein
MGKDTRILVGMGCIKETDDRFAAERKRILLHMPLRGNCCY